MRILSALLLLSLLVGCNEAATEVEAPEINVVHATAENRFAPPNAPVRVGGTITWNFGSVAHNVVFETKTGAPDNIQQLTANFIESRVFTTVGLFRYSCTDTAHPPMVGEIDVRAGPSTQ
jgi:plastocyanin